MTKLRRVLSAALMGIALFMAFPLAADQPKTFFTIGTGTVDGLYYPVGQAICRLLTRLAGQAPVADRDRMVRCSAQPSGGSVQNINQLAIQRIDFGIAQSDVAHAAFAGEANDSIPDMPNLRAVFSLHAEPFHLVAGRDSGIRSFADLRGKRVNIGPVESGQRAMMEALMMHYGLALTDLASATEMPPGGQAYALCRGDLDAFVLVIGAPDATIARATDECGAYLVPVKDAPALALVKEVPGYALATIPRRTYATTTTDVPTIGVVANLVTTAEMDDGLVYTLTRTVIENINEIRGFNPALAGLKPETMSKYGITIPLHPGALRYYKERGWINGSGAGH